MKNFSFFLILMLSIASCTKEETKLIQEDKTAFESLNFVNIEELEKREIEYSSKRDEIEAQLATNFLSVTAGDDIDSSNIDVNYYMSELTEYHSNKLTEIFNLRESIGFISIQSVADEINSLKLISPEESEFLYNKYGANLSNSDGIIIVSENIAHPNITNPDGVLLFDGININSENKEFENTDNIILSSKNTSSLISNTYNTKPYISSTHISGYSIYEREDPHPIDYMVKWGAGRSQSNYILWNRSTPYTYYFAYIRYYNTSIGRSGSYTTVQVPAEFHVPFGKSFNSNCGFASYRSGRLRDIFFIDFPRGTGSYIRKSGKTITGTIKLAGSIDPSVYGAMRDDYGNLREVKVLVDRIYLDDF